MQQAGFEEVSWRRPQVSEAGLAKHNEQYWRNYVDLPGTQFLTAFKPKV